MNEKIKNLFSWLVEKKLGVSLSWRFAGTGAKQIEWIFRRRFKRKENENGNGDKPAR